MCDSDIQSYMDFVMPLVMESGKELLKVEDINVETKNGNIWDVVTVYDRKIEELLIDELKKRYPDHRFIGEEESSANNKISKLTNSPTWIIDPIDGTANFVKRMPITCISIGLTISKEQVLGIVYNPYMNELYTAIKGRGAFLNGKRIFTSGETEMKKCIFNYEISLAVRSIELRQLYMSRLNHLITKVSGVRSYGCAALGLCYVGCGRIDAYQCDGLYPWDVAAGSLIVREAGGHVIDSSGNEFDLMKPNFLATSTQTLSEKFMKIERRAEEDIINMKNSFLPENCKNNLEKTK